MTVVDVVAEPGCKSDLNKVTTERIDRAINTVARMVLKHDMPQLIVTIRRLELEREKLQLDTAAMDYAKEILRDGRNKGSNIKLGDSRK